MARLNFTAVQATTAATEGLTLEDIPVDVREDVEEVYKFCKENPTARMRTPQFASKTEALAWQALATAYCALRPDGAISLRRSPTRGLPDTQFDFRIKDIPEGGNGTNDIRNAVQAASDAAKATSK